MAAPGSVSDTIDTGAGSGVAGVGAQSRQTEAGAGVAGTASQTRAATTGSEAVADIGLGEAYGQGTMLNLKRLIEGAFDHDAQLRQTASTLLARMVRNAENADDERQRLANLALNNAVQNSAQLQSIQLSERERTVRHSDIAGDRMWNVDEVAELVAKTPVLLDAIMAQLVAKVAAVNGVKPA